MSEIAELKARVGLEPYRQLLDLRKVDGLTKALCPWHDDSHPSLVVYDDGHHHCFACGANGDALDLVRKVKGLSLSEAWEELEGSLPKPAPTRPSSGEPVAIYPYTDEVGNLLFEVLRYEPKSFRQRRPLSDSEGGGWGWTLGDVRKPLYHLQNVRNGHSIWLVEGEKDVHALESLGLTATTAAGGAGAKWLPEHTEALRGKQVFIIPDDDKPGWKRANQLHATLPGSRIVKIPAKDAAAFVEQGGTREELEALIPAPWFDRIPVLTKLTAPPISWMVPHFVPEGTLILIAGAPGSYKSFFALDLARRVAAGQSFAGLQATVPRKVLYLDAENGLSIVVSRREYLQVTPTPNLRYWGVFDEEPLPKLDDPSLLEFAATEKPLIVLDSLIRWHKGDENSNAEMAKTMGMLLALKGAGATVIVLHHAGKDQEQKFRGASEIEAAPDLCFKARRVGEGDLSMSCFKNRFEQESMHALHLSEFGFEYLG